MSVVLAGCNTSEQSSRAIVAALGATVTLESSFAGVSTATAQFGAQIAASNGRAVVGAPGHAGPGPAFAHQGAAYLYVFNAATASWDVEGSLYGSAGDEEYGSCVAMGGTTAVIGSPGRDSDQGAVEVYVWSAGLGWTLQSTVTPSVSADGDRFGAACSVVGDTLVVGAPGRTGGGGVYVFQRTGSNWLQQSLVVPVEAVMGDEFGSSVAVSTIGADTYFVSGAPGRDESAANSGAAYYFRRASGVSTWSPDGKVTRMGPAANDGWGTQVALSGGVSGVSAPGAAVSSFVTRTFIGGSAYAWVRGAELVGGRAVAISGSLALVGRDSGVGSVTPYVLVGATWSPQSAVGPSPPTTTGMKFGDAVAITGTRALVGAPNDNALATIGSGSIQGFEFTLSPYAVVVGGKRTDPDENPTSEFGSLVAMEFDGSTRTIVIGEPGGDVFSGNIYPPTSAPDQGVVHVYTQPAGGSWSLQGVFTRGAAGDGFGSSVAVRNNVVAVGAKNAMGGNGCVYVYTRTGSTWSYTTTIQPTMPQAGSEFGRSVSLSDFHLIVGAPKRNTGVSASGAAFVFASGSWTEQTMLAPLTSSSGDEFGASVATAGDTVIVGAPNLGGTGAAFVYRFADGAWSYAIPLMRTGGAAGDHFGASVAVERYDNRLFAVGAPDRVEAGIAAHGAVYVFATTDFDSFSEQKVLPAHPQTSGRFGAAVSLSGITLATGQPGFDGSGTAAGAVELSFALSGPSGPWTSGAFLSSFGTPSTVNRHFGATVSAMFGKILAGAPGSSTLGSTAEGAAYVFRASLADGMPCGGSGGHECESLSCVDGVCCDSLCGVGDVTDCLACSVAAGALIDGVCGPVSGAAAIECRASQGLCDPAEVCDGTATECPGDVRSVAGTTCHPSGGGCDPAEVCDGVSATCPSDVLAASSEVCRSAIPGGCDIAEYCTGTSVVCPIDAVGGSGITCRTSTGMCDVAETCTGAMAECPADVSGCCGLAADCDDGDPCTTDTCVDGVCGATRIVECCTNASQCEDGDLCTIAACVDNACESTPIVGCCISSTQCDDGDECTLDACTANACRHDRDPTCTPDAGTQDAGADAAVRDAAAADGAVARVSQGGCCSVAGSSSAIPDHVWGLAAFLALLIVRRRRRQPSRGASSRDVRARVGSVQ